MLSKAIISNIILILCIIILISMFLFAENNTIVTTKHTLKKDTLPKDFNNFKIVQISDFHNKLFKKNNTLLINKIKKLSPDIIVITGDLVDRRNYNEQISLDLIKGIKSIAPIYLCTGNHEGWSLKFDSLENELKKLGVIVLRNESIFYTKNNSKISIIGIDDPAFSVSDYAQHSVEETIIKDSLLNFKEDNNFKILLSHRPEYFHIYVENNIDLIFSGHAHGGQFILPLIGGILAPNQGFSPKYYKDFYNRENTTMIVSRGIGNSIFPQRLFNKPELVVVTLTTNQRN